MGRQETGKAALFWAVALSIVAHAALLCLSVESEGQGAGGASRFAATLVLVDRALAQSTPREIASAARRSLTSAPAGASGGRGTGRRSTPPAYVASDQLDKRPVPLADLHFPYPDVRGADWQGKIELTLYIGSDGRVDRVDIDSASVDQTIVDLAVESLHAARFSPAERNGKAVGARLRLEVSYDLLEP